MSYVKCIVRRYAKANVKEGDGLSQLKIRRMKVPAEKRGRNIIRTELMMFFRCKLKEANHAIYRKLNLTVSNKLR